jgi:hypothetical protein
MRIHVRAVTRFDTLKDIFRTDGWSMTEAPGDGYWLSHPEAPDQKAARRRLGELDLLTSPRLCIRFESCPGTR